MATTPVLAGGGVYIRTWENGDLLTEFSRNPRDFAMNRYLGFKNTKRQGGLYLKIKADQAARVPSTLVNFDFPDGQKRPQPHDGKLAFGWYPYQTKRKSFGAELGELSIEQAAWPMVATHAKSVAQQCMTYRTYYTVTVMTTAGNWVTPTGVTMSDTQDNLTGNSDSLFDTDTDYQNFKKLVNAVRLQIAKQTIGAFNKQLQKGLKCVMSPVLAASLGASKELVDFIKQTPSAIATIEGREFYEKWGLPTRLYGCEIEIEDAVRVSSTQGATDARDFIYPSDKINFTATPGTGNLSDGPPEDDTSDEEGRQQGRIMNAVTGFLKEDMTTETFTDKKHRNTEMYVTDDFDVVVTAPEAGYLVTTIN